MRYYSVALEISKNPLNTTYRLISTGSFMKKLTGKRKLIGLYWFIEQIMVGPHTIPYHIPLHPIPSPPSSHKLLYTHTYYTKYILVNNAENIMIDVLCVLLAGMLLITKKYSQPPPPPPQHSVNL
jgi:hypothetical protein